MKTSRSFRNLFYGSLLLTVIGLTGPQMTFGQTEKFDIAEFTPPKGWERAPRDGAVVFKDVNKTTGKFCVLTIYASSPGSGNSAKDFADQWAELVVDKFKAQPGPKTESQASDGWQATVGGTQIETGGLQAVAVLSVMSGFGKTVSLLAVFNDESYLPIIDAFGKGLKLDKIASPSMAVPATSAEFLDFDPFPDKPHFQPQQPLLGRLKKTITLADIAGKWQVGGANVTSYFSSSSGNYSSTDTTFFGEWYTIRPNGAFDSSFQGRTGNHTVRESDNGTITLSGGTVTFKFNHKAAMRYQFVAYMVDAKGGAVLTLIHIGDDAPFDGEGLRANCGHAHGFVSCLTGESWMRLPVQGR